MEEAVDMEYNTAKHAVTPGEVLPAGELLGDLLMEMGNPAETLKAYEFDLQQHPNRLSGLYGEQPRREQYEKIRSNEIF